MAPMGQLIYLPQPVRPAGQVATSEPNPWKVLAVVFAGIALWEGWQLAKRSGSRPSRRRKVYVPADLL